MPKKRKKPVSLSRQKAEKAHHRNEFAAYLKTILDKAVGPEIFHFIPQHEIEDLYRVRCPPVRIKAAPSQNIPAPALKEFKYLLTLLFKNNYINVGIGELSEMSLYDYFSTGFTIILYAIRLKEDAYPHAGEVKKALAPFAAMENSLTYKEAWKHFGNIMTMMSWLNSTVDNNIYILKQRQGSGENSSAALYLLLELYCLRAPIIQVTIDRHKRPAYRLGWPVAEPTPQIQFIDIKTELIDLPPGNLLKVYIQSHAINRLNERMDGIDKGLLHFNLLEAFSNPVVCKNSNGDTLFEYRILGNKAGYFKADIVSDQLILRTFLFLTNNGTPEAEKLHTNTGMVKEDKAYLAIDKLSTFLYSDIAGNERVKQIFLDAGCESLFNIDKTLYFSSTGGKEKSIAGFIARYLQLDMK